MGLDAKSWTLVVHNLANRAISLESEGLGVFLFLEWF